MDERLTDEDKRTLLRLAREALQCGVEGQAMPALNLQALTPILQEDGASFVTLTIAGELRGCIGALEPYQPLAEDVREHAVAAALDDPRFRPVSPAEVDRINIEVSRLTLPKVLEYSSPEDLLEQLRPGIDGVILRSGIRRATFLPQVWKDLPDKEEFLDHLCYSKLGVAPDTWRRKHLDVFTYEVEEFGEVEL